MKRFDRYIAITVIIMILAIVGVNLWAIRNDSMEGRPYLVEVKRVCDDLTEGRTVDLSQCKYVRDYYELEHIENEATKNDADVISDNNLTSTTKYDYCIRNINGRYYRIEYETASMEALRNRVLLNIVMVVCGGIIILILLLVRNRIISPFHKLEEVPYQLSKGNLTIPLEENKNKIFGRFIWGTNLLRENIEERRRHELEMHKEKKTVLLSLAHDIKTPLSVIKLNAQALQQGLYSDEDRKKEAAGAIIGKVDEIGSYVSQIVAAAKDDFIKLEVIEGELYLNELISRIDGFYKDKMSQLKIDFTIDKVENCLLSGDIDRLEEVMQNLIENAIKYGDGRHIGISFYREEDCQIITLSNTGNSLPWDENLHVFESFYRGSNVGSKEGSGLGMYICRKLMTQMKGDIFTHPEGDVFNVSIVIKMV